MQNDSDFVCFGGQKCSPRKGVWCSSARFDVEDGVGVALNGLKKSYLLKILVCDVSFLKY
jgi:hypothetical protein